MSAHHTARAAGLLYLIIIFCGLGAEFALRGPILALADPIAGIAAQAGAFRLSLLLDLLMVLADVALACLLYLLLRPVSPALALLAVAFRLVQAAMLGAGLIRGHLVLSLAQTPDPGSLAGAHLQLSAIGYDLALAPFGLSCLTLAALMLSARHLPHWLGWSIGVAGLVYLSGTTLRILAPDLVAQFQPAYILPIVAESAFCIWLLTRPISWEVGGFQATSRTETA